MSFPSTCPAIRFSMSRSNSLYVRQSREIGRKLFASDGSLPGFSSATTLSCRQSVGIFLLSVQLLKRRSSQSRALGTNCLIKSVRMPSRPEALPFFNTLMPTYSSTAVHALVNPESSGYHCQSILISGCIFGIRPFNSSWCATWLAVTLHCCFDLLGSLQSLRTIDHAFLLL